MEKTFGTLTYDAAKFAINEYVWPLRAFSTVIASSVRYFTRLRRHSTPLSFYRQLESLIEPTTLLHVSPIGRFDFVKAEDELKAEAAATLRKVIEDIPNNITQGWSRLLIKDNDKEAWISLQILLLRIMEQIDLQETGIAVKEEDSRIFGEAEDLEASKKLQLIRAENRQIAKRIEKIEALLTKLSAKGATVALEIRVPTEHEAVHKTEVGE
jgi:hypothetical protein